jgi:hypothetical protein
LSFDLVLLSHGDGATARPFAATEIKMKTLLFVLAVAVSLPAAAAGGHGGHRGHAAATGTGAKAAHEHVSGYTRKDGKHVAGHDRSTKDSTKTNNWSTKGNKNPETGKAGTK